MRDSGGDIAPERVRYRLTDVEAFEHGQTFGVALHHFGELEQNALLVAIVEATPRAGLESAARACDGGIDVGRLALGDVIENAAVPRRDVGESLSRGASDRLAADHGFAGKLQGTCDRFKVRE